MLTTFIIAAVVVADQLSKAWIMAHFALYESVEIVPGLFSLTYLTNRGAAFGLLNGDHGPWRHLFFIVVAVVAMVTMVVFLRQMREEGRWPVAAIALIFGGAVGNLIDRLRFGSVVDFLDCYWGSHHWPAFNIADSAITVGVGIYLLTQLLRHRAGTKG